MNRIPRVRPTLLLAGLAWYLATTPLPAQPRFQPNLPPDINSEEAGQDLARQVRSSLPEEDSAFRAILKTRRPNGSIRTVPLECRVTVDGDRWTTSYQTQATMDVPAQTVEIVHGVGRPITYRLMLNSSDHPATWKTLTPVEAAQPLAGSDFWLIDLALDFLHWPQQRLIRTEMRKSRWCYLLESRLVSPSGQQYGRVLCWLDKEKQQPLLAEAYDAQDNLLKEFSIGSIKKVNGQWQVQDMKISNVQARSRTWLEFDLKKEDSSTQE